MVAFSVLGVIAGLWIVYADPFVPNGFLYYLGYGFGGFVVGAVVATLIMACYLWITSAEDAEQQRETIRSEIKTLQREVDKDVFRNLVELNYKYIDQYYDQTKRQADKSFRIALIAAIAGFAVMIAGVIMMLRGSAQPGYVSTAAGLISQFIAAVFFYLYNKTIIAMAGYHRKLVLTQNISLALRITEDLKDKQEEARLQLIDRLSSNINALLAGDGDEDK